MPKLIFSLIEQDTDLRSNEKAYKFMVENEGSNTISLLSITPRIPQQVEIGEDKNPSLVTVKARYLALCEELTEVLRNQLFVSDKTVRENMTKAAAEYMDGAFKQMTNMASSLFFRSIGFKRLGTENVSAAFKRRLDAFTFKIERANDADRALEYFIIKPDTNNSLKDIFVLKVEQLKELEKQMGLPAESSSLATIEPDSFFASTYTLKFPRSYINPRVFNLSIEGTYSEQGKPEKHVGGASTTVIISPKPYVLSIIAVISSILGVLLRLSFEASKDPEVNFYAVVNKAVYGSSFITALILALIFFNIYEFTGLGKNFKMNIGWRTALLIGTLCGLLSDRILIALKAFIGA
jgi:hypothetical protein